MLYSITSEDNPMNIHRNTLIILLVCSFNAGVISTAICLYSMAQTHEWAFILITGILVEGACRAGRNERRNGKDDRK